MKHIIPIMVILLLVSTSFIGVGNHVKELMDKRDERRIFESENFNAYSTSELFSTINDTFETVSCRYFDSSQSLDIENSIQLLTGLMNSSWPMYCHDVHHTGHSLYNTSDNPGTEIWRFQQHLNDFVRGSPIIGEDNTIYFGGSDFYALYPNGTVKWKYDISGWIHSCPAIDTNGTIYIGDVGGGTNFLYALNSNGTFKWKFSTQDIYSSPAIGVDGAIYFGDENKYINALWPNGTIRWRFKTGNVVYSSPAIGDDGTVYCGSHDTYLYALYPNNGTLKWKYKTGHWIRTSPCIADDGTIYVVSLDEYLHAVYPNGTLKWKTDIGAGTSPTIDKDGTIYCGYTDLYAVNPTNGSIKWVFDPGSNRRIRGATPCNSNDGIIHFGTFIGDYSGGEIIAVNSNGTERWRKKIANIYVDSAPAIGKDGRIYIGSAWEENGYSLGYLHAFGIGEIEVNAHGPYLGLINTSVKITGFAQGGYPPYGWIWDFGDGNTSNEQNPIHIYKTPNNYTVTLTVTDNSSNQSSDTTWAWIQESNDPPEKPSIDGEIEGKKETLYYYKFKSTDPEGLHIWYKIEWGDGAESDWLGPYDSGTEIERRHQWDKKGTYVIRCKAKDPYGDESEWGELTVTMPHTFWWFNGLLDRFPLLQMLLEVLIR